MDIYIVLTSVLKLSLYLLQEAGKAWQYAA